jgi:single-stranded-DNA-specific exonuclease
LRINRKRWVAVEADPLIERRLMRELGVGAITAHILAGRNMGDPAQVQAFLRPRLADLMQPETMCGAPAAAVRIADAVERGESIAIHGDYDADGVTATALLVEFLRAIGSNATPYIPDRIDQGYGFGPESATDLAARGHKLLITVDCGANDHDAVRAAVAGGMDVIITDHHEIAGDPPPAVAVLNPHQAACGFHGEPLAGVGIAFFLAGAVRGELVRRGHAGAAEFDLKSVLDLVALGTVADIVPLTGQNRILVAHGLPLLNESRRPGVAALRQVAKVGVPVRCGDISYRLAPRINAAGRLSHADVGVNLLLTRDPAEGETIARHLNEENAKRQAIEAQIFSEAKEMFEKIARRERLSTIVLAHPDWHPGVIGIVASRMVEEFNRPTILLHVGEDSARGSGRSISAFNLFEALQACGEFLEGFGGHAQAAGVKVRRDQIVPFAIAFDAHARATLTPEDMLPRQRVDAWCEIDDISDTLVRELSMLAPFGFGNPEPVLATRDVPVLAKQVVGHDHLKLRVPWRKRALVVMAYSRAELLEHIGSRVDLAYSPEFNTFGGVEQIQLRVKDVVIPDL